MREEIEDIRLREEIEDIRVREEIENIRLREEAWPPDCSGSRSRNQMSGPSERDKVDALARALDFLAAGEWQRAHEIVQEQKSPLGSWLHGIVHTLEGDLDNAQYWYRKAKRDFPGAGAVPQEIAAARSALAQEHLA